MAAHEDLERLEAGAIVGWLAHLGDQIGKLDEKNDKRFDQVDERLERLETDRQIGRALTERRVRKSDTRRHVLITAVGITATLAGGGVGVLIQHLVG